MAQQDPQQIKIQPEDPEYNQQEHILYKRRIESSNNQLRKLIQDNLSQFKMVMDGTTFAYTKLSLSNRGLINISQLINQYPHLRILELNSNQIAQTSSITKLNYVTNLNLSRNLINQARFLSNQTVFPYLKSLNLSNNKLKSLPSISLNNLRHLNANGNEISSLEDFQGHQKLEILQLRFNKLKNLKGLHKSPQLREVYLAQNEISSLKGMVYLQNLQKLHLRKNKISELIQFPAITSLKYINLRQNQISKVQSLSGISPNVIILNLIANPVSEELGDNTKKQVWIKFRNYQKVNKSQVTAEQKQEFEKEHKERIAQQERQERQARQQAQQAERQAKQAKQAAQKGQ